MKNKQYTLYYKTLVYMDKVIENNIVKKPAQPLKINTTNVIRQKSRALRNAERIRRFIK